MAILWDENLRTGVDEIDEQHKKLFRLICRIEKTKKSIDMFRELVYEVDEYVKIHFDSEEYYMEKYNYPDIEQHKVAHIWFRKEYKVFLEKAKTLPNTDDLVVELSKFLENWIKEHYTNEDVRMAIFLKNNL